jgi:hypothetical protein
LVGMNKDSNLRVGLWRRDWMSRRSKTGTRRSRVRSNPGNGGPAPDTEKGQPPNGIEEAPLDVAPERDRGRRSRTSSSPRFDGAAPDTENGQPPSEIEKARPPPDAPSTRLLPLAGSRSWSLCGAEKRPAHGEAGPVRVRVMTEKRRNLGPRSCSPFPRIDPGATAVLQG